MKTALRVLRGSDLGAWLFLACTLPVFYPFVLEGSKRVFLGIDLGVIFYPLFHWAVGVLRTGHFPLLTDLTLHGAPLAAISPVGLLSPLLYLPFLFLPFDAAFNVMVVLPNAIFLFGAYHAGRALGLSRGASVLLACLWTYNGTQMAQTDRLLSWGCATFPWAFWALVRRACAPRRLPWLLVASFLWGLCLLSGHLTMVLFQGVFFACWLLLDRSEPFPRRGTELFLLASGALLTAAPRLLFTADCLSFDPNLHIAWGETDRFFHSWWPVNVVTLFFPWFFGKFQYDYHNDFWWQYHFNETQAALSLGALFFVGLFLKDRHARKPALVAAALFGLFMALGRFSPLYRAAQHLPVFSLFRDPARWWFLTNWALGLGAAYGWERWFSQPTRPGDRRIGWLVAVVPPALIASLLLILGPLRPLMDRTAAWCIRSFLRGDALHPLPLSSYVARLPEKYALLAHSADPTRPEVALPLLFSVAILALVHLNSPSRRRILMAAWLLLILFDLWFFKMPYGSSFQPSSAFQKPPFPASEERFLNTTPINAEPYDPAYRSFLSFPNTNLLWGLPSLTFHLGKSLPRYADIDERVGWFAWVYKDRVLEGWKERPTLLRTYGVGFISTDSPPPAPEPFRLIRNRLPYLYALKGARPRAIRAGLLRIQAWPDFLDSMEHNGFDPLRESCLDAPPHFPVAPGPSTTQVVDWSDEQVLLKTSGTTPGLIVLQKSYLPSWRASLDGVPVLPLRCDGVLLGVPVPAGEHVLDLKFNPTGLRLGFFLSLLFLGTFLSSFTWGRRHP